MEVNIDSRRWHVRPALTADIIRAFCSEQLSLCSAFQLDGRTILTNESGVTWTPYPTVGALRLLGHAWHRVDIASFDKRACHNSLHAWIGVVQAGCSDARRSLGFVEDARLDGSPSHSCPHCEPPFENPLRPHVAPPTRARDLLIATPVEEDR